jgi:hypothetical protein
MRRRGEKLLVAAAVLLLGVSAASAQGEQVNTLHDLFVRLHSCWKPPPPANARPIDITVVVSFNRAGEILGHPRITYESKDATDNDRLQYRIAVMEALQRCSPMPFTEAMAGAAAGRPVAVQFHGRKTSPPTQERKA